MKKKLSLNSIAFFQALGLVLYCGLVALLLWKGNTIFVKVPNYLGPFLFLTIFSTSALICALITLTYPIKLYLKTSDVKKPLQIIIYMSLYLLIFILAILSFLI
jgi:predicted transglutaminase-like protease